MAQTRELLAPSDRQRLLDAMASVCARRGYMDASIDEVAAEAGSSRDAFERIFGSKEACLVDLAEVVLSDTIAAFSSAYSVDASLRETTVQSLRAMLELFAARPALAHLAFIGSRQMMPPSILAQYAVGFGVLNAMLGRLRSGEANGLQLPTGASRAAIGSVEALLRREIAEGRTDDLPHLLPDVVYAAAVPLVGQEEGLKMVGRAREVLRGSAWG
jgi:AcrR family transcriptional regulator